MRFRVGPRDEAKASVPAAYMPLYTYLDRRYAATVVLTFEHRVVARIRPTVTSIRGCRVVDAFPRGDRSPQRRMDGRAAQRSPAAEGANRYV